MNVRAQLARLEALCPEPESDGWFPDLPVEAQTVLASAYLAQACHEGRAYLTDRGERDYSGRNWSEDEQDEIKRRTGLRFKAVVDAYQAGNNEAAVAEARTILDERRGDDGPTD